MAKLSYSAYASGFKRKKMKNQFFQTIEVPVLDEATTKSGKKIRLVEAHDLSGQIFYVIFMFKDRGVRPGQEHWNQISSGHNLIEMKNIFLNIRENR